MSSTFTTKDGTVQSRIKPTLSNGSIVTDTRANINYFVTEYGIVNLKGLLLGRELRLLSQLHILISGISLSQKQKRCISGDRAIRDNLLLNTTKKLSVWIANIHLTASK